MFFFKPKYTSPNYEERVGGQGPSMIVIHYTGMKTAKEALERLCDPASKVSTHILIDEKGRVHRLVPEDKRAWHAGRSYWAGATDINSASIGIELANKGHEFGYHAFSERQIGALGLICLDLIERYDIPAHRILGHSDVAITRKIDPGHLFPWERLAARGIGAWPALEEMDLSAGVDLVQSPDSFHALLCSYGYDPQEPSEETIMAFHRHFCPERYKRWDDRPAVPDAMSCARLLALLRAKNAATEKPPGFPGGSS